MNLTPGWLKRILNYYGPYLGAGVRVDHIAPDWQEIRVSMQLRWYNRNAVGTHFGGSLYSMVDPHLMLMLMNLLGREYIVWDKAASIEFLRPGRGRVQAVCRITDMQLAEIRQVLETRSKCLPEFELLVVDDDQKTVARVKKVLYVRKKGRSVEADDNGAASS